MRRRVFGMLGEKRGGVNASPNTRVTSATTPIESSTAAGLLNWASEHHPLDQGGYNHVP